MVGKHLKAEDGSDANYRPGIEIDITSGGPISVFKASPTWPCKNGFLSAYIRHSG
jgi:hypothetical protein